MFTPRHLLHLLKTLRTEPRYFYHRLLVLYYQFRKPTAPWLTIDAIRMLEQILTKEMTGFEWGSGQSTVWLAGRLKSLVAVEHNADWYETVRRGCQRLYERRLPFERWGLLRRRNPAIR